VTGGERHLEVKLRLGYHGHTLRRREKNVKSGAGEKGICENGLKKQAGKV